MTGKEAIIHYLGTHKSFCAQDVVNAKIIGRFSPFLMSAIGH